MSRKEKSEYKNPLTTKILAFLAALGFLSGIFWILTGISSGKADGFVSLYVGVGCLLSSALLFVIADMSSNLHFMEQNIQSMLDENREYQSQILQLLQNNTQKE